MLEGKRRDEEVKGSSNRTFGLVFAVFCGLIGLLKWWNEIGYWQVWLGASAAFLLAAFLAPKILGPLNMAWMKFGLLLHKIVSPLTLALIFFLGVLPVALVMRLFGKLPLDLSLRRDDPNSYWIARPVAGPKPDTMTRQF